MSELVFLKLGGSVITDKCRPFTAREDVLVRLGREICDALKSRPDLHLVIGHGSGSFGHHVAHRYQTHLGDIGEQGWYGFAETSRAAAQLHRIVIDVLFEAGVPALSVQPSASALCHAGDLISLDTRILTTAMGAGLVPVVYGDVAIDNDLGFTIISTEKIFDYLCAHFEVSRIVLAGIVDGVFDRDPLKDPEAIRYVEITPNDWAAIHSQLHGSHATDVTGGMMSKVHRMLDLVKKHHGVSVSVVSGEIPENIVRRLTGMPVEGGTTIHYQGPALQAHTPNHSSPGPMLS